MIDFLSYEDKKGSFKIISSEGEEKFEKKRKFQNNFMESQ